MTVHACNTMVRNTTTRDDKASFQGHTPRMVESQDLLQGRTSVLILHQGEVYRLQSTRQGKLILTK